MSRLVADRLTVVRGGRVILEDISLAAPAGAFVAVIGANGAGKSTLLTALAGLLAPESGRVLLDDAQIAAMSPRALALRRAFLPQSARCEWPISVERLVALGLTPALPPFGRAPAHLSARVEQALADFDLVDRRAQAADTLSGGELARAMLARALVADPDVIIADEPFTGLDPRHAIDSARRLRGLADAGKLVVASMHDLTLAARCATHVAALNAGRLAAFGETGAVLTARRLEDVFGVEARVSGTGAEAAVDFVWRSPPPGRPA